MRHDNAQAWTPDEDNAILCMVEQFGKKWAKIAKSLAQSGRLRTPASVRNRFIRIKRGEQFREVRGKNRCAACGEIKLGHVCKARITR